jgi:hypothetical protein
MVFEVSVHHSREGVKERSRAAYIMVTRKWKEKERERE